MRVLAAILLALLAAEGPSLRLVGSRALPCPYRGEFPRGGATNRAEDVYVSLVALGTHAHPRVLKLDAGNWETIWQKELDRDGATGAVVVDADGLVYVAGCVPPGGLTEDALTVGPGGGNLDACVVKLDPDGNVVYAVRLGGSAFDSANALAVDAAGCVLLAGRTNSVDFPVRAAFQPVSGGSADIFLAKIGPKGEQVLFSTYIGGTSEEAPTDLVLDRSGGVCMTGWTMSRDFPLRRPRQAKLGGAKDAFLARFSSESGEILTSTFLGGSGTDDAWGIALDEEGGICVVGRTDSPDFPTVRPSQATIAGDADAFVTRFASNGEAILSSTYLGGAGAEWGYHIAAAGGGRVYVVGNTSSRDFPIRGSSPSGGPGRRDAFLTKLDLARGTVLASTTIGGWAHDGASRVVVRPSGVLVLGYTESHDFPSDIPEEPRRYSRRVFIARFEETDPASGPLPLAFGVVAAVGLILVLVVRRRRRK